MCGIYGYLSLNQKIATPANLSRMAAVTVHRGPNDEGVHVDGPLAMGMRRLSIIDVTHGHQPISNETGDITIVCNGEIYNFRELRRQLIGCGHRFKTESDTEVALHLYEDLGEGFVNHLDGMFALAIWDRGRKKLLLCRDRLGIKPLYLRRSGTELQFASELKALIAINGNTPVLDQVALSEYLAVGYVPGSLSLIEGVEKLPAGHLLIADANQVRVHRYWQPRTEINRTRSTDDWSADLLSTVEQSVQSQMVSDVPLGAFLSGGIDSSAVVAMMAKHSKEPINTYSIGFDSDSAGEFYNELPYAAKIAQAFGTNHHEIVVRPDVISLLPRLLWHLDEPVADSAFITTYLISEFAAKDVTVILSGVGGDELFGGYRRYLGDHYLQYLRALPRWFRKGLLEPIARRLPSDRHSRVLNLMRYAKAMILSCDLSPADRYQRYVGVFSNASLDGLLNNSATPGPSALKDVFSQLTTSDPIARLMELDLLTQLPDDLLMLTDRMSMAASLECRVPLLDQALVDLALTMPSDLKIRGRVLKYVLKHALREELPPEILHRSKRGFGAPMGAWLKGSLAPLVDTLLNTDALEARGTFRPDAVRKLIDQHNHNEEDHTDHLQALINLEIWSRIFIDGRSPDDIADEMLSNAIP